MSRPNGWTTEPGALFVGWSTFPKRDDADRVARTLVEERLVACAQTEGPIRSHYRWEGRVCEDEEFRLTLKFIGANAAALEQRLHALHPYSTPQWIVVEAVHASADYLHWARGKVD